MIVCCNDDELLEKFGTDVYPDEYSDDALKQITARFTRNHNPHMDPSMTFALGFSTGGSLTCYQYQNKQYLIHLPLDAEESKLHRRGIRGSRMSIRPTTASTVWAGVTRVSPATCSIRISST